MSFDTAQIEQCNMVRLLRRFQLKENPQARMNTQMQHALGGPQDTVPFVSEKQTGTWQMACCHNILGSIPELARRQSRLPKRWDGNLAFFCMNILFFKTTLGRRRWWKTKTVYVGAAFCTVLWSPLGPQCPFKIEVTWMGEKKGGTHRLLK